MSLNIIFSLELTTQYRGVGWPYGNARASHLWDPGSHPKFVCGLSFSQSQPYSEGFFSRYRFSSFPPSAKSTPSLFHLAVVLRSMVIQGLCSGAKRLAGCTAPSVLRDRVICRSDLSFIFLSFILLNCLALHRVKPGCVTVQRE